MDAQFNQSNVKKIIERLRLFRRARSFIMRDVELAYFLIISLLVSDLSTTKKLCEERFGKKRTPSRSAIHRFWTQFRIEADKLTEEERKYQ
jgi:hypothetical protein